MYQSIIEEDNFWSSSLDPVDFSLWEQKLCRQKIRDSDQN